MQLVAPVARKDEMGMGIDKAGDDRGIASVNHGGVRHERDAWRGTARPRHTDDTPLPGCNGCTSNRRGVTLIRPRRGAGPAQV